MLIEDLVQILDVNNNKKSTAMYLLLARAIRREVLNGHIATGTQLPASRYFAKALSVSRSTIVNAYDQLVSEGIAESKPGDGTYICTAFSIPPTKHAVTTTNEQTFSRRAKPLLNTDGILDSENHPLLLPGLTDLSQFPDRYWKSISNRYAHQHIGTSLSRQHLGGYQPLREAIAQHLNVARNIQCEPDQIIIHNGLHQAARLIFTLLSDPGDTVLIEDPGYSAIKSAALMAGLTIKPLATDEFGATIPMFCDDCKMLYITPSHQFPMGTNMPLARRLQLIEFAHANNSWIIEDDYDSEFPLNSKPVPALKGLDNYQRVFYTGTFSKALANYIRVSYLVVPNHLKEPLRQAAKHFALEAPFVLQATIADYIDEGHFHRHIRRMRAIYSEKKKFMSSSIATVFAGLGERRGGETGLHMTIEIDSRLDDLQICREASHHSIGCRPLSEFCLTSKKRGLVLGFGYGELHDLERGINKLAEIVRQHLQTID